MVQSSRRFKIKEWQNHLYRVQRTVLSLKITIIMWVIKTMLVALAGTACGSAAVAAAAQCKMVAQPWFVVANKSRFTPNLLLAHDLSHDGSEKNFNMTSVSYSGINPSFQPWQGSVNGNVVNAVVQRNTSCWDGCGPDSKNMSSTCWIDCLFNVLTGADQDQPAMTDTEILAPFEASFATDDPSKGGCPTIPACPAPCHPPTEMPALEEVAPMAAAVDADAAFSATTASLEEALAVLQGKTLDNCNPVAWDFCCEVGTKCDCSKGITAPGQCKTDSYDFCCGVGKVCDCTTPPPV